MKRPFRRPNRSSRSDSQDRESDFGIPIPGLPLPEEQWAKTAWKKLPPPGRLDWTDVFGREAPVILDIGCGNGRFTITSALQRPERNHLAIDILPLTLRYATRRANQRGLHHVRFAAIGGEELLRDYVPPHSLAEIHLYHPQPYRDPQRQEERLVTPEFLLLVRQTLVADGLFVIQTDNRGYWLYFQKVLPALFHLEEHPDPWPDAPRGRTRREIYARQHKMPVFRGICRPRTEVDDLAAKQLIQALPQPRFTA